MKCLKETEEKKYSVMKRNENKANEKQEKVCHQSVYNYENYLVELLIKRK